MDYYHVTLEGFPADSGDVVTKDGEVVGIYTCDENDFCKFIPNGSTEPIISAFHVGPFCREIADWHAATCPD